MLKSIIILISREKNTKLVKRSKVITQQLKTIQKNPHIADRKWAIIEHLKISHKLFKTTRQVEKISLVCAGKNSNSPLCSETKTFLDKQNEKKKQKKKKNKKKKKIISRKFL